ncbi:MAG TPA: OmpA family protein [Burkholderiales bacterium]|nr:OmpA family protein [Burkholderiales bacterium]
MNKAYLAGAAAGAALALSACVTQGTYDKLEAEKAQEIDALQSQRAALQTERDSLQQQKVRLEKDKAALEQDKAALEREQAALRAQTEALERERAKLLEASKRSQAQYDSLARELNEEVQKGQLQVRQYKDMLTVDVAEQLFFDSGRATLKETGKEVLKRVADAIKSYDDKAIRVVGHTDNVPISGALQKTYASNWELSVARATTVVRFLQESGIEPERLVATGRAEYAPVAENDSPEGRQKNRRIEITLINRNLL